MIFLFAFACITLRFANGTVFSNVAALLPISESSANRIMMYELGVNTHVKNRYATTLVTTKTRNLANFTQEVSFFGVLPETALVSGFELETCGIVYRGFVEKKKQKLQLYRESVNDNRFSFAINTLLDSADRNYHTFTVTLSVKRRSKVIFRLTYEELLMRENHRYQIFTHIYPGQLVKNLTVTVRIDETRPLSLFNVMPLNIGELHANISDFVTIQRISGNSASVRFMPDLQSQMKLVRNYEGKDEIGLSAQFGVEYDVERNKKGGELLIGNGIFAHFFAPTELSSLKKHVIFVLDTSGSMENFERMSELKEAMSNILPELRNGDVFNIIQFTHQVYLWDVVKNTKGFKFSNANKNNKAKLPPAFQVTKENIQKAKKIINDFVPVGGTDIKLALEMALNLIIREQRINQNENSQPMIIFLTDGEPYNGEKDPERIISSITQRNEAEFNTPIFSLSFGNETNREFLQKLSLKNHGYEWLIYDASDANEQFESVYAKVSDPLLKNINFTYSAPIHNPTKTFISNFYFNGSEIVVAGIITGVNKGDFEQSIIAAEGESGVLTFVPEIFEPVDDLERLWAFLSIKQNLLGANTNMNVAEDIALQYSFVTSQTSMIVSKPNSQGQNITEEVHVL